MWLQRIRTSFVLGMAIALIVLTGCSVQSDVAQAPPEGGASDLMETPMPNQTENLPRLSGEATVQLTVNGSPIVIQVNGNDAPITAGNFIDLVNRGVYNNLVFHRVVRDPQPFVVQGGDPQGSDPNFPASRLGTGGFIDPATQRERQIPLEIKPEGASEPVYSRPITDPPALPHTRGAVAMARSQAPDSASSQFYITLADLDFLNGNYAVFGYVTSGMDVVDQIQQGDRIETATVVEGIENLQTAE
ncbi:MAG: peptidylprolyl isomerase [Cyanobacteria bacterium J06638_22]